MANLYNDGAPSFAAGRAKSTLTAFFDRRSDAETAIEKLKESGVSDVRLLPGHEADKEGLHVAAESAGFWSKLEDWLFPDDDRTTYAEALLRGGFLVSAGVDDTTYEAAHAILDDEGAIDMDERADLWRANGWAPCRDQQATASRDDVFQTDVAAGAATGLGRYQRSDRTVASRVRAYDMKAEIPDDIVDDILPTGHQRDVSEGDQRTDDRLTPSQSIDDLRQRQSLPGSR